MYATGAKPSRPDACPRTFNGTDDRRNQVIIGPKTVVKWSSWGRGRVSGPPGRPGNTPVEQGHGPRETRRNSQADAHGNSPPPGIRLFRLTQSGFVPENVRRGARCRFSQSGRSSTTAVRPAWNWGRRSRWFTTTSRCVPGLPPPRSACRTLRAPGISLGVPCVRASTTALLGRRAASCGSGWRGRGLSRRSYWRPSSFVSGRSKHRPGGFVPNKIVPPGRGRFVLVAHTAGCNPSVEWLAVGPSAASAVSLPGPP